VVVVVVMVGGRGGRGRGGRGRTCNYSRTRRERCTNGGRIAHRGHALF